jgi:hypothetical protein
MVEHRVKGRETEEQQEQREGQFSGHFYLLEWFAKISLRVLEIV